MNRRHAMTAAAASLAAAAGLGVAWWQRNGADAGDADGSTSPVAAAAATDAAPIWSLQFDTVDGPPLALQAFRGRPLLLNFWATWCAPCVTELPLLDRFHREHAPRGWQVLGLAIDQLVPVRAFLDEHPVGFAIALAGGDGIALARTLGNSTGGLPFTVAFDRAGGVAGRKVGILSPADLSAWQKAIAG